MPSRYITGKTTINLENVVFEYGEFYHFMKQTLEDLDYFINEKSYSHAPSKKRTTVGFYWECLKNVDDFNRFIVEIKVEFANMERITVIKDKEKNEMDRGDGEITMKASLLTDYEKKWEKNPVLKFVKVIFENLFEKSSLEHYKNEVDDEMYEIENEIKSYFNLQRMMK